MVNANETAVGRQFDDAFLGAGKISHQNIVARCFGQLLGKVVDGSQVGDIGPGCQVVALHQVAVGANRQPIAAALVNVKGRIQAA